MALIRRSDLNRPLTYAEMDGNFQYLEGLVGGVSVGSTPSLQQVTDIGNSTTNEIFAGGFVSGASGSFGGILFNDGNLNETASLSSLATPINPRNYILPDKNGTIAIEEDTVIKVTTAGVERVYTINPDGSQATKPTSDFGTIKGTGSINRISKFTASGTIGDSQVFDNGTSVGIGAESTSARLDVRAQGALASDIAFRVRNSADTRNFLVVNGAGDVYNGAGGVNPNTFFGENVGRLATGGYNTAFGGSALRDNTTGVCNTAFGGSALQSNTTGRDNTAIGFNSLRKNTTEGYNTAIGSSSLSGNTTGSQNTAIGNNALQTNTTGNSNTAIGFSALLMNTTGESNTAIGLRALHNNTTGGNNTAIGIEAGSLISGYTSHTVSYNSIFIGHNSRALANEQTNQIVIGNYAEGLGSNSVVLGNDSITRTQLRGQVIMGSFASAPTGIEGAIYYDSTTKKHYGYDGTTWNALY